MTYGSDFAGVEDLDFGLTFLQGEEPEQLALSQAIARRYVNLKGAYFYSPGDCMDLRNFLADSVPLDIARGLIAAEARKDERIVKATCEITVGDGGSWNVKIQCFGDNGTSFPLTFLVTPDNVEQTL